MPADMNDYFKKKQPNGGGNNKTPNPKPAQGGGSNGGGNGFQAPSWLFAIIAIIAAIIFFKPFTIINSGEVGIKVKTGKFDETPLNAGLHFYIPMIQNIITVNTRMRQVIYSNQANTLEGDNYKSRSTLGSNNLEGGVKQSRAIPVLDKRGLTVNIDLAVQYQIRAESAPKTIEQWGSSWEEKIINSKVREVVRDVIGQYTAEKLPEMRNEIATAIQTKVTQKINSLEGQPVILSAVELRNIELPEKIRKKIEELQAEKQNVNIAEQQKERAKQEAQKNAEIARGEAERNRIVAQGQADKIRIEAEEQAKANALISNSLTPQLLELEQIKTQAKFNDALKVNKDAQIFLTPGGAVPNIWVDAKGKEQRAISAQ
ncbi:MAG: Membrane protease family protein HP0248 [uncultured Sulfurovum sp.]|uniref:Membrane protease family protein HP0248 n=1 Tax=uncultured Sulfurovum sp. TaxID=269237 RepID=A0A6S6TID0_9BACT|nr:MAG: Membrane protease family protein HP0248 [uncultured Sulfurovum sp.]